MDNQTEDLPGRKTELEVQKLELENQQLRDEIATSKSVLQRYVIPLATPLSIIVTLLIAYFSLHANIDDAATQAATQSQLQGTQVQANADAQKQAAQYSFEQAVAQFVLTADTPDIAKSRANAVLYLFPGEFSDAFRTLLTNFDAKQYYTGASNASLLQDRQFYFDAETKMLEWVLNRSATDEPAAETSRRFVEEWNAFISPSRSSTSEPAATSDAGVTEAATAEVTATETPEVMETPTETLTPTATTLPTNTPSSSVLSYPPEGVFIYPPPVNIYPQVNLQREVGP